MYEQLHMYIREENVLVQCVLGHCQDRLENQSHIVTFSTQTKMPTIFIYVKSPKFLDCICTITQKEWTEYEKN